MPTFLSDPTSGFYLGLIAVAVIAAAVAARKQNKKSVAAFGLALAALLVVFLIDRSAESPREEAVRRAAAMGEAANAKNPDAFVEHLAETFEYDGGAGLKKKTRSEMRTSPFWSLLRQFNVRVTTWGYNRADAKVIDDSTVEIGFLAKGEAEGKPYPLYVRATFKKQPDGSMKMTQFRTFNAAKQTEPMVIPQF